MILAYDQQKESELLEFYDEQNHNTVHVNCLAFIFIFSEVLVW